MLQIRLCSNLKGVVQKTNKSYFVFLIPLLQRIGSPKQECCGSGDLEPREKENELSHFTVVTGEKSNKLPHLYIFSHDFNLAYLRSLQINKQDILPLKKRINIE